MGLVRNIVLLDPRGIQRVIGSLECDKPEVIDVDFSLYNRGSYVLTYS